MEKVRRIKRMFRSPALGAICKWSEVVRWPIIGVNVVSAICSLLSLGLTLVIQALVDGATGGKVLLTLHFVKCEMMLAFT